MRDLLKAIGARIAATALLLALASFCAAETSEIFRALSGQDVARILTEEGYLPSLKTDGTGNPKITFKKEGATIIVYFYGAASEATFSSLQFTAIFSRDEKFSLEDANAWNSGIRYSKVYVDSDKDAWLEFDIDLGGGLTRDAMVGAIDLFCRSVTEFRKKFM